VNSAPREGSRGWDNAHRVVRARRACPQCHGIVPRESWSAARETRGWRRRGLATGLAPQLTGRRGQLCLCVLRVLWERSSADLFRIQVAQAASVVSGQWSVVSGGLRSRFMLHASRFTLHRSSSHRTSRGLEICTGELVLCASRLVSPPGVKPPTPIRFCSLGSLHDQDPAGLPTSSTYIHPASPPALASSSSPRFSLHSTHHTSPLASSPTGLPHEAVRARLFPSPMRT
jgi:hypothetical protein